MVAAGKAVAGLAMHLLPRPELVVAAVAVVRGRKWCFGRMIFRQASRSRWAQAEVPQVAVVPQVAERLARLVAIPRLVDSLRHMAVVAVRAAPMQLRLLAAAEEDRPAQAPQVVAQRQSQAVIPEIQIPHQLLAGRAQALEAMRSTEAQAVAALQTRRAVTRCKTAAGRCLAALVVQVEAELIQAMFV